jgi:signal transduction histidine kinase
MSGLTLVDARDDPDAGGCSDYGGTGRGRAGDVLAVLLPLAAGLALLDNSPASGPPPLISLPLDAAAGIAGCLALGWRRRAPVVLTVVLTVLGVVTVTGGFAGLVALFAVAVHRRASVAIVVGVATLAAVPLYQLLPDRPDLPTVWGMLVTTVVQNIALVGWGMFVRARRQLVDSLRERAVRAETEQRLRVDRARRAERTGIAREMHDVLAHRISLVSLHAGALELRAADARPEDVATAADVIRANARQALQELRQVIGVLREGDVAPDGPGESGAPERPQPGVGDVPELVAAAREAGTGVTYSTTVQAPADVPPRLGRTVYRLVQEGLTNARKHAPGTPVEVVVDGEAGGDLQVRVTNPLPLPGRRSDVPGARVGLVGLSERVSLVGGRLDHGPDPDTGTFRLHARLPWTP